MTIPATSTHGGASDVSPAIDRGGAGEQQHDVDGTGPAVVRRAEQVVEHVVHVVARGVQLAEPAQRPGSGGHDHRGSRVEVAGVEVAAAHEPRR